MLEGKTNMLLYLTHQQKTSETQYDLRHEKRPNQ